MRNQELARDYVRRAEVRLRAIEVLYEAQSWADVVRESQEVVELALNGLLRAYGVEPPRIHDVSALLTAERDRLPAALHAQLPQLAAISRDLRRDRELAFFTGPKTSLRVASTRARTPTVRKAARSRPSPSCRLTSSPADAASSDELGHRGQSALRVAEPSSQPWHRIADCRRWRERDQRTRSPLQLLRRLS